MYAGYSFEKRFLKTITIKKGDGVQNKKVIFIDAGMQGREWISISTALYIIQNLLEKFEQNAYLLERYDWVVMPLVNPDGYEFSRSHPHNAMWKKTRQPYQQYFGADPSRNFDLMFGGSGTSSKPKADAFTGPHPFSEPEVVSMRNVLLPLRGRIAFYLTLHSFGGQLMYPWGFTESPVTHGTSNTYLRSIAEYGSNAMGLLGKSRYEFGNFGDILYPVAGGSMDYAYAVCSASFAMTMNIRGGGHTGYHPPESDIKDLVMESGVGIAAMVEKIMELCETFEYWQC